MHAFKLATSSSPDPKNAEHEEELIDGCGSTDQIMAAVSHHKVIKNFLPDLVTAILVMLSRLCQTSAWLKDSYQT